MKCKISDPGMQWDTLSTYIEVVEKLMYPPEILEIEANPQKVNLSGTVELNCVAQDANSDTLSYEWTSIYGNLIPDNNSATFSAPITAGNYYIVCTVTDTDGMTDVDSIEVMVRDLSITSTGKLIAHYPLNGNALDASGNELHGTTGGVFWADDKNGTASSAAHFNGTSSYIHVTNNDLLNFQDAISIACWINIYELKAYEQHPISHGNWENRYKISIGNNKIRFTLKTSGTIKDLDSETSLVADQWHHLATVYDGNDMEIWLDGKLDAFTSLSGLINQTSYDLAFGQHLAGENGYNFNGTLDAVSIYDYALSPEQILAHMEHSIDITSLPEDLIVSAKLKVYPNPVTGNDLNIIFQSTIPEDISVALYDLSGKQVAVKKHSTPMEGESTISMSVGMLKNGMYILSIINKERIERELIIISR